jgi:hypothetical protein
MKQKPKLGAVYHTSYCNHGHRLFDGRPVDHECYVLPPAALQAEREDRIDDALRIMHEDPHQPRPRDRGIQSRRYEP